MDKNIDLIEEAINNIIETLGDELDSLYRIINTNTDALESIYDIIKNHYKTKDSFIELNAIREDDEMRPIKIKVSNIIAITDVGENVSELTVSGLYPLGIRLAVAHSSDEILEMIRKSKRTEYEVFKDTLKENGITEDEINCYVAHQSPDLAAPFMRSEEMLKFVDEVKKAKADGFDFSIETLERRRKEREKEMMERSGEY